jgi:hypothetical protein
MSGAMPVEPQRLKRRVVPREFLGSTAERILGTGLATEEACEAGTTQRPACRDTGRSA